MFQVFTIKGQDQQESGPEQEQDHEHHHHHHHHPSILVQMVMPAKTSWSTHVLQPQPCMSLSRLAECERGRSRGCAAANRTRPGTPGRRPACRRSSAVPTCRRRSERAFEAIHVACADWQGGDFVIASEQNETEETRDEIGTCPVVVPAFPVAVW